MKMKTGVDCIGISTSFYCHDGKGNFLFHRRSNNCRDEVGVWDCGGGQLEYGLSLETNVLKEVREEYGCVGKVEKQLPAITLFRKNKEGQNTHWIVVPFIIRVERSEVKNNDPEKIEKIEWHSLNNLPHPLHPGFIKTIETHRSLFHSLNYY